MVMVELRISVCYCLLSRTLWMVSVRFGCAETSFRVYMFFEGKFVLKNCPNSHYLDTIHSGISTRGRARGGRLQNRVSSERALTGNLTRQPPQADFGFNRFGNLGFNSYWKSLEFTRI